MAKQPVVSGADAVKAFGLASVEQPGGDGLAMSSRPSTRVPPRPTASRARAGTLRALIRAAGLSVEEFAALL